MKWRSRTVGVYAFAALLVLVGLAAVLFDYPPSSSTTEADAAKTGQASADMSPLSVALRPGDPMTVSAGAQIYTAQCASCHGANLEGQANWRKRKPDGRLPAPPHDETGHTWHHPDAQLFALTKYGPASLVSNGTYETDMPGYDGVLSDAEIIAVLSFIKSTWSAEVRQQHDQINARSQP